MTNMIFGPFLEVINRILTSVLERARNPTGDKGEELEA
jgi:hypothetical protein